MFAPWKEKPTHICQSRRVGSIISVFNKTVPVMKMMHVYGKTHLETQLCLTVFCPCFWPIKHTHNHVPCDKKQRGPRSPWAAELVYGKMPVVFQSPLSKMVPPKRLQRVWFWFDFQLGCSTISSFDSFIHSVSGRILQWEQRKQEALAALSPAEIISLAVTSRLWPACVLGADAFDQTAAS